MSNNQIKKEPEETYCPVCGKPIKKSKVRILLIYPIYFLAGIGISLITVYIIDTFQSSLDFNQVLKSWSSLWLILEAGFWSMFIAMYHNHMENGTVKLNNATDEIKTYWYGDAMENAYRDYRESWDNECKNRGLDPSSPLLNNIADKLYSHYQKDIENINEKYQSQRDGIDKVNLK